MTREEDRLVKIESALAHLENLTETLNETIIAHEKTLRQQQQQIKQMTDAMRAAHHDAGVLQLYGNYGGDIMNFDMASEMLEMEGMTAHMMMKMRLKHKLKNSIQQTSGWWWTLMGIG